MRGVMLDRDSLHPEDLDFSGLAATLTDWDWHPSTAVAELPGRLAGREVVVTNKVPLDGAAIREAVDLRLICVAATGVDNVDLGAARARGIPVCNVRNYGTAAVGQHVLALLLDQGTARGRAELLVQAKSLEMPRAPVWAPQMARDWAATMGRDWAAPWGPNSAGLSVRASEEH